MLRRPSSRRVVLALTGLGLVAAACGGEEQPQPRPLPDVDPPAAAQPPAVEDGAVTSQWLDDVSARTEIPRRALQGYASAAARLAAEDPECSIAWNTISGIGRVESVHGAINGSTIEDDGVARPDIIGIPLDGSDGVRAIEDTDEGRLDDDTEWDRAVGPLQFIPTTWSRWGADGDGDGQSNPQDVDDAALAAGRYLCGATEHPLDTRRGWLEAVLTYNESAAYAEEVASYANRHARLADGG